MKQHFHLFLGIVRYEFLMQLRRRSLWITFLIFTLLILVEYGQGSSRLDKTVPLLLAQMPLLAVAAHWAFNATTFLPICVGALLADRYTRDRRTHVDELLTTMPVFLRSRLFGKYIGSLLATLIPMFLVYSGLIGYTLSVSHNWLLIPYALETFIVIALPGVLFAGAFSIAVPAVLWVPLYQFLFICYWFWNTLWFHADLFNLGRTILAPTGLYIAFGFYDLGRYEDTKGPHGDPGIHSSPLLAIESTLLLIALAILVIFALEGYIRLRRALQ
ncbi:ABC transporter permease [Tengunoibacter tsumagoiensis]|uniref:Uncharacterized protein n=1 Tax=Tengunoibacter tsumagoiensis TaxID=2014871 RepID=A0A401ZTX0_9CHLR|nr:hypothetical protein [Tengunoibacter tsumagoiensis]GCE10220.1 hypothetical protein KTT_00790 [Tengunoibacter tsumagoiensis]